MSARRAVFLVARREIGQRVRSRAFLVSTAILVVLACAAAVLPPVLGIGGEDEYTVGTVGSEAAALGEAMEAEARHGRAVEGVEVKLRSLPSQDAARRALAEGMIDLAVVGSDRLLSKESPPSKLETLAGIVSRESRVQARLSQAGLSPEQRQEVLNPPPVRVSVLDADAKDRDAQSALAFVGVLLLYIAIITYGVTVAYGVVEEKSSRVIELVLATVRPAQLLAGKVLGIGALGVGQLLLVAGAGLGLALAVGSADLPPSTTGAVVQLVLWFLLGYAFYSCAYAATAALVSRQEDMQSSTAPLTYLLIGSYFVSLAVIENPEGLLARVTTFVPPLAPVVVPARAALGAIPLWETLLAVAVMVAAVFGLIVLAGRIYASSVLRLGAPVKIREALRAPR